MSYLALTFFVVLSLLAALVLLALSRWWSPSVVARDQPRSDLRLPLQPYRVLFFALIGEVVLLLLCAWAVHFRAGLALGRAHLAEVGIFALIVLVGLFYLLRKEGRE